MSMDADPEPHQREWYTHARTGDRGWKVIRGGKDYIKLDRPNEEIARPFQESDWMRDNEIRPLTVAMVARIAFEADRQLCFYMRQRLKASKEWEALSDRERLWWMERGPRDPVRAELYAGVFSAMREFYR